MKLNSFLQSAQNRACAGRFRGDLFRLDFAFPRRFPCSYAKIKVYSAAYASDGFMVAAEIMKSEIRGTISDLKREPLNTP
jgi:hypothetical protein